MAETTKSLGALLIVDDDQNVGTMLKDYFGAEGFTATAVRSGAEMRKKMGACDFDLVMLDIGLPGEDGLALAREIRASSDLGIVMLTGRGDIVDRIVGMELGADDYIAKPFHLREVLARVKAVLRRIRGDPGKGRVDLFPTGTGVGFGSWQFFPERRCLMDARGDEVALTSGEFEMLAALVRNAGRVLSRDQLIDITRGRSWAAIDRTVDVQIARLRKKIEKDPKRPSFIRSVRGTGYVFAAPIRKITG